MTGSTCCEPTRGFLPRLRASSLETTTEFVYNISWILCFFFITSVNRSVKPDSWNLPSKALIFGGELAGLGSEWTEGWQETNFCSLRVDSSLLTNLRQRSWFPTDSAFVFSFCTLVHPWTLPWSPSLFRPPPSPSPTHNQSVEGVAAHSNWHSLEDIVLGQQPTRITKVFGLWQILSATRAGYQSVIHLRDPGLWEIQPWLSLSLRD